MAAAFAYDPSGQRTRSVVTSGSVITTTTYTYEGTQLFKLVASTPSQTTTLTYLYDELGRPTALAAQVGTAPVCFAAVSTTKRGDVISLNAIEAGGSPTMLGAYGYDEYGNPSPYTSTPQGDATISASVAAAIYTLQPLRYAGYTYDSYSGLYYCSQRYYDPATMQWISPDPANSDGEQSAYQYCGGDPVNRVDPTGRITVEFVIACYAFYCTVRNIEDLVANYWAAWYVCRAVAQDEESVKLWEKIARRLDKQGEYDRAAVIEDIISRTEYHLNAIKASMWSQCGFKILTLY